MAKKIIAFIQARMGSTRLPGKVALPLGNSTVLEQVVNRVSRAKMVDETILVTTLSLKDLDLVKLSAVNKIRVFCGSEEDVLDRYYQAAKLVKPDHVIRITADCPLMDSKVIDLVVGKHLESGADYTSNVLKETYPDGLDIEVFKFEALKKAWKESVKTSDREHVTLYIRNNPKIFKLLSVENTFDTSQHRWTLDEPKDYEFIKGVYSHFSHTEYFGMADVLNLLEKNPSLLTINQDITRNEGLIKSLKEDKEIIDG